LWTSRRDAYTKFLTDPFLDVNPNGTATATVTVGTSAVTPRYLDPYGNPRTTPPAWTSDHGFLNAPINPFTTSTGAGTSTVTHLGARDYDSVLGRFLTVDPVLDPANPLQNNGYSYGWNNPLTHADPGGTRPACADEGACGRDGDSKPGIGDVGCDQYCGGGASASGPVITAGSPLTFSTPGAYAGSLTRKKYGCDSSVGNCFMFVSVQEHPDEYSQDVTEAYRDWTLAWKAANPEAFADYERGPCGGSAVQSPRRLRTANRGLRCRQNA
jgi:RHS repeat-associated protein